MKRMVSYFKKCAFIAACSMGLGYQSANAQSIGDLVTAINAIRASLDGMVNTAATYIFQTPPNIGNELVTNNTLQVTAVPTVPPSVSSLNEQDIVNGLSPQVKNPNLNLTTMATIKASDTVLPSITIGGLPVPFFSSAVQQNLENSLVQGNANLNFQSLITPPTYSSQDLQNYAMNYIRFISGYAVPISNFNLNSYPESQLSSVQKLQIQNSANYQAYQVQRRQLIAQQSAALSNLYWIYSKRMPIPTIQAGDTGLGIPAPSVAQIEEYNSTWRSSSPVWYTQMSTSSQTNVEREILFVLAEIQVQLHRLHQDNERMIALTAINQISGLQTAKQTLALAEKQVQDNINQQISANTQSGTTSGASATQSGKNAQQQSQAQQLKDTKESQAQSQAEAAIEQANQGSQ